MNEVQWLLRESDVVVMQTVTKVQEVKAMREAAGVAAERLGIFLDRLNEEEEEEDVAVVVDSNDEVQEKEQKKHIGAMIKSVLWRERGDFVLCCVDFGGRSK